MLSLTNEEFQVFDTVETVDAVDEAYLCPVCKRILNRPFQLMQCGHRICYRCLSKVPRERHGIKRCPVDKEVIEKSFEDKSAIREMLRLACYCLYKAKGCSWMGIIQGLLVHFKNCNYATVPCEYASRGCDEEICRMDFDKHIQICEYRLVDCKYCQAVLLFGELKEHYNDCVAYPVECTLCGEKGLIRQDLEAHQRYTCKNALKACSLADLGCTFVGSQDRLSTHFSSASAQHMSLLAESLEMSHTKATRVEELTRKTKPILIEAKDNISNIDEDENKQAAILEALGTSMKEVRSRAEDSKQILTSIEERNREKATACPPDVQNVSLRFEKVGSQLSALKGKKRGSKKLSDAKINERINKADKVIDQLSTEAILKLDLSIRMFQSRWTSGRTLWKIDKFTHRLKDAIRGHARNILSPPLYTKVYGYKLCLSLHLNGEVSPDVNNSGFVSFHVRLMRTEYDALLRYPFSREVKVSLIDQSNGVNRKDIVKVIYPEGNLYGYKLPVKDMNEPVGFARFCSHRDLYERNYVVEDVIFFKVEIERFNQHDL